MLGLTGVLGDGPFFPFLAALRTGEVEVVGLRFLSGLRYFLSSVAATFRICFGRPWIAFLVSQ